MRHALVFVVVAVALDAVGGGAHAQGVAVTSGVGEREAVLAGPHLLLPAGSRADPLLRSFSLTGGRPTPVGAQLEPPARGPGFAYSFDASESTVALIRYREEADGGDLDARPYAGPLGGRLTALAEAVPVGGYLGFHESVSVSGHATLLQRNGVTRTMLSIHEPGAPERRLPSFTGEVTSSAIVGGLVAFSVRRQVATLDAPVRRLVVIEWRSGRVRYDRTYPWDIDRLDLGADERVVLSVAGRRGEQIVLLDPAGNPRLLVSDRRSDIGAARFAGSRIVAIRRLPGLPHRENVVAVSPVTGAVTNLSPRTESSSEVDADAKNVIWTANDCALATPADGPPMRVIPAGPCLRDEVSVRGRPTGLPGRRIAVGVYCQTSAIGVCRGTLRLRLRRKGKALARRTFRIRAETSKEITLRVTRGTRRRLRRLTLAPRHGRDLLADATIRDVAGRRGTFSDYVRIRKHRRP